MKAILSSVFALSLLAGGANAVQAAEAMTDNQLDSVTAGAVTVHSSGFSLWSAGDEGGSGTSTSFAMPGLTVSVAESTGAGQFGLFGGLIVIQESF